MVFDMIEYTEKLRENNINITYSGPMWGDGIKGIAEMIRTDLSGDEMPNGFAKKIFSVFIEQVTNVLMYSAEKEKYQQSGKNVEISKGIVVLGRKDKIYFIQTGNTINEEDINLIKKRIDHVNSLDKSELRKYHIERLQSDDDNPQSKGAGLGFIEIARRSTAPIQYDFRPLGNNLSYFTMYVEISQLGNEE